MANSKNNKTNNQVKEVKKVTRLCNLEVRNGKLYLDNTEVTAVQTTQLKQEINIIHKHLFGDKKSTYTFQIIAESRRKCDENKEVIGYEFKLENKMYIVKASPEEFTDFSVYDPEGNRVSGVQTNFNEVENRIVSLHFMVNNKSLYLMRTSNFDKALGYFSTYIVKERVKTEDESI